jgi:hypothetical protein
MVINLQHAPLIMPVVHFLQLFEFNEHFSFADGTEKMLTFGCFCEEDADERVEGSHCRSEFACFLLS